MISPEPPVIICCSLDGSPPVGFTWARKLINRNYNLTLLLHGNCTKYSQRKNPYQKYLRELHQSGIEIVRSADSERDENELPFVRCIGSSIDYLIHMQLKRKAIVFYDTCLPEESSKEPPEETHFEEKEENFRDYPQKNFFADLPRLDIHDFDVEKLFRKEKEKKKPSSST